MPPPAPLAPLRSRAYLRLRLHIHLPPSTSPSPHLSLVPSHRWPPPLRASASSGRGGASAAASVTLVSSRGLDALLSAAELLCLVPPAICSAICVARLVFSPPPPTGASASATLVGGRMFVVQYLLLVGAVAIGNLIRRRQLCRVGGGGATGVRGVDFAGRIGKVEESVRGVVAAVGVLSRTVEKLGVRFRVLRRTLRDPINETATLAQKNSEATRVLAAQEDLLEKELGEIQKVLYAMQEQQQKQLELILAIGEASRILDDKEDLIGKDTARSSSRTPEKDNKKEDIKAETVTGGNNKP